MQRSERRRLPSAKRPAQDSARFRIGAKAQANPESRAVTVIRSATVVKSVPDQNTPKALANLSPGLEHPATTLGMNYKEGLEP